MAATDLVELLLGSPCPPSRPAARTSPSSPWPPGPASSRCEAPVAELELHEADLVALVPQDLPGVHLHVLGLAVDQVEVGQGRPLLVVRRTCRAGSPTSTESRPGGRSGPARTRGRRRGRTAPRRRRRRGRSRVQRDGAGARRGRRSGSAASGGASSVGSTPEDGTAGNRSAPRRTACRTLAGVGRSFDSLSPALADAVRAAPLFFVATAPLAADGHVNVSPKGGDTLRVLDERTVAYLDLTGSGVETIAHLRENGRITLMVCAFSGPPQIIRLYGRGEVVRARGRGLGARWRTCSPTSPGPGPSSGSAVERVGSSCGYAVPLMRYEGERIAAARVGRAEGRGRPRRVPRREERGEHRRAARPRPRVRRRRDARCRARSPSSPGRPAASARRWPGRWPPRARRSSSTRPRRWRRGSGWRRRCPTPPTSRPTWPTRPPPASLRRRHRGERYGRLDVLVNNAGTTVVIPHHDLEAVTPDVWRRIFDVNVIGTWQVTVAALPAPAGHRGRQRRERHLVGGRAADRQLHPLRGVEGGAQPRHPPAWPTWSARRCGSTPWPPASSTRRGRRIGTRCAKWCVLPRRCSAPDSPRTSPKWCSDWCAPAYVTGAGRGRRRRSRPRGSRTFVAQRSSRSARASGSLPPARRWRAAGGGKGRPMGGGLVAATRVTAARAAGARRRAGPSTRGRRPAPTAPRDRRRAHRRPTSGSSPRPARRCRRRACGGGRRRGRRR